MAYLQAPASALDFALNRGLYVQPPASATDFDLGPGGEAIIYPPVPGVIMAVGTAWSPRPGRLAKAMRGRFSAAERRDISRSVGSDKAALQLDPLLRAAFARAADRGRKLDSPWSPVATRERQIAVGHANAPAKDLAGHVLPFEAASQQLEQTVAAPFLVKTPWKGREIAGRHYSSAVYAATIWRRQENLPAPLAKVTQGIADLEFLDRRVDRLKSYYPLGGVFENNPIQPKDGFIRGRHGDAAAKNRSPSLPWGPAGHRDTTLHFEYPTYTGPIDVPGETFIIPTLRFYIVANSAQIVRVSDGRDVAASSVSLSIDYQSYQWAMTAQLAGRAAHALVEGTDSEPVEVDVTINDVTWRVLIDGWSLQQAWRQNGGPIRGRSRSAYLAPPYGSVRDHRETVGQNAQQLAAQELPPGWTLDWDMVDWFVPAGAWQYQGLSPLQAIARIAEAGGGYVQSDLDSDTILVLPQHAVAPWALDTATPDYQIPRAVMVQRGVDKRPGTGVNGVILHGGDVSGIAANVVVTGTAGDVLAATIVDNLLVDTIPARERGIVAIADTLRQARETHVLPLSDGLGGMIPVGSIVDIGEEVDTEFVGDWRGVVRGVSITAQAARASNGGVKLSVRQQLSVDRYFTEE